MNIVTDIINIMYKYQKIHNIKRKCVANSFILHDILKYSLKQKNVSIITGCIGIADSVCCHTWVKWNDTILEPSFEWKNAECYYDKFETIPKINNMNQVETAYLLQYCTKSYDTCKKMLKQNKFCKCDYYNNMWDYLNQELLKLPYINGIISTIME